VDCEEMVAAAKELANFEALQNGPTNTESEL
jgi:hypothetical protein